MTRYEAPHAVRDAKKVAGMVAAIKRGEELPAILVIGETALCGSHRLAAYAEACVEPVVCGLEDDDYIRAIRHMGLEPGDEIGDYGDFWAALRAVGADTGEARE